MQNNNSNKLIGVVLCGGKSSRMQSDKGLLSVYGKRWFEISFDLLSKSMNYTLISVNFDQHSKYKEVRPELEFVIDSTDSIEGPLRGIFSVHEKYPDCDLFILACDMIAMDDRIINSLSMKYNPSSNIDLYLFKNEEVLETLCGIYTSNGIRKIKEGILKQSKKNFAIRRLISTCNSLILPVEIKEKNNFANINTPGEINSNYERYYIKTDHT